MRTALVYIPIDGGSGTDPQDGTAIQVTPAGGGGFEGLAFIAPTADHPHGFVIVNETLTITTGEAFENLDAIAGVAIFRAIIFEDTRFGISYKVKIGTREVVVQVGEDHADSSVALATLIDAPDIIIPTPSGDAVTIGDVNARIAATIETYARINVDGTVPGTRLSGTVLVAALDEAIGNTDWRAEGGTDLSDDQLMRLSHSPLNIEPLTHIAIQEIETNKFNLRATRDDVAADSAVSTWHPEPDGATGRPGAPVGRGVGLGPTDLAGRGGVQPGDAQPRGVRGGAGLS